jgi:hypothetical protein
LRASHRARPATEADRQPPSRDVIDASRKTLQIMRWRLGGWCKFTSIASGPHGGWGGDCSACRLAAFNAEVEIPIKLGDFAFGVRGDDLAGERQMNSVRGNGSSGVGVRGTRASVSLARQPLADWMNGSYRSAQCATKFISQMPDQTGAARRVTVLVVMPSEERIAAAHAEGRIAPAIELPSMSMRPP